MNGSRLSAAEILRLSDDSGDVREFAGPEVRIGRDPACEWCIESGNSVSAVHARMLFRDGRWWLEDAGSRNGTFIGRHRLVPDESIALQAGVSFRLAAAGPTFRVVPAAGAGEAGMATLVEDGSRTVVEGPVESATLLMGDATALLPPASPRAPVEEQKTAETRAISRPGALEARERALAAYEQAAAAPARPVSPPPGAAVPRTSAPDWGDVSAPPVPRVHAVFKALDTKQHFALTGPRARIGRSPECEFRVTVTDANVVSRVHAELRMEGGVVTLTDSGSSFGTYVNGGQLSGPREIVAGDLITLGLAGPRLLATEVNGVRAPEDLLAAAPASIPAQPTAAGANPAKGMTLFVKRLAEDAARSSTRRLRHLLLGSVVTFAIALVALQVISESRASATKSELERQRREAERVRQESRELRAAASREAERLQAELQRAQEASAPRATVESLQRSLESAMLRTGAMEASLTRAGSTLRSQLAATDSLRRRAEETLSRLRADLARAQLDARSRSADSLQRAVEDAQRQLTMYDAQFRTLQSVTIAGTAEGDQRAIGEVTLYRGRRALRASAFVISASGYLLSARDALGVGDGGWDSVSVSFGDDSHHWPATVASVSRAKPLDVVLLKIRDYNGAHLRRLDWAGTRGAVNEPAAIIGYGGGDGGGASLGNRPHVSAAIVSRSAQDRMRLEVFGAASANGSPVFGANGEVIGMLQLALPREGVAYAARLYRVVPILPPALQAELGIRP